MARPLMADRNTNTGEDGVLPAGELQIDEDDPLVDDLIWRDPPFREMLARYATSPRRGFRPLDLDPPAESAD